MSKERNGPTLQTLERGLTVLELLTRRELGPTEIAQAVGVDRATVHRILRTLLEKGFAERADVAGRYRANLQRLLILASGMAAERESDWLVIARSYVEELYAKTRLSANLAVPSNKETVYVMQVLGEGLSVHIPPGTRRPLHCSALGKAYLGSLPEPELDRLLATLDLTRYTPNTITSPEDLKRQLREGRRRGYYVDNGERDPMVRCIASPVCDHFGRTIASIGISFSVRHPATQDNEQLGPLVAEVARKLSAALGYRGA